MYKLWETSWNNKAVRRDKEAGIFTDPSNLKKIDHDGTFFRLNGIALAEPSPQRTPVIFQAGTSSRGQYFAAKHAECVFVAGPSAAVTEPRVRKLRAPAEAHGRKPGDILIYAEVTVIPGVTATEAQAKICRL